MNSSSGKSAPTGRGRWLGPLYIGLGVIWLIIAFTLGGGRIPELIAGLLSLLTSRFRANIGARCFGHRERCPYLR